MDLIGLDAKLYRGAAGGDATTLCSSIRKVKLGREWLEGDNSRRGRKTKSSKPTMRQVTIEFEVVNSDTDTDVAAFENAASGPTPLAIKCLDKETGRGILGDFYVFKNDRDEDEEKEQVLQYTLKPTVELRDITVI